MKIGDLLKARPGSKPARVVSPDIQLGCVAGELASEGAVIVSRDGKRCDGLLSARDLAGAMRRYGPYACHRSIGEVMTANPLICAPDDKIEQVAEMMERRHTPHAAVVDRGGATAGVMRGVVSALDILSSRLRAAEAEKDAIRAYISAA